MAVKKNDDKIGQEKNEIDNELGVSYVYPFIGHTRRFKRATLEKQDRELVFTHDERGEVFRVAVERNQSGELKYSPIHVGEVDREDLSFWQKAERVLQEIKEEAEQQSIRQRGMSSIRAKNWFRRYYMSNTSRFRS